MSRTARRASRSTWRARPTATVGSEAMRFWAELSSIWKSCSSYEETRCYNTGLMLDALKFAFEILIVGALALPWLAVLYRIFQDGSPSGVKFDLSFVPEGARNTVSVALVVAVGYLLGSAVSRFSRDFFNDEIWQPLPTEDVIRDSVYFDEYCAVRRVTFPYEYWSRSIHLAPVSPFCPETQKPTVTAAGPNSSASAVVTLIAPVQTISPTTASVALGATQQFTSSGPALWTATAGEVSSTGLYTAPATTKKKKDGKFALLLRHFPPGKTKTSAEKKEGADEFRGLSPEDSEVFDVRVQEVFQLQDSELMLQGVEKVDRLKQYFDQITVLRGAAFNGFILFSLALFGMMGQLKERWSKHRGLVLLTFLPAALAAALALNSLRRHWYHGAHGIYSDPPLAEIVILLVSVVGLCLACRPELKMPYRQICVIAAIVMVVTFGGWWWTEVMYDLQVIHSNAEMKESGDADSRPAASVHHLP